MTTGRPAGARTLVAALCSWNDRLFPDADRRERLNQALTAAFGDDEREVSADLCREIEQVAHRFSRHLELGFDHGGSLVPDTESPGWPPQDADGVRARAASVGEVSRRGDGIGVLALDSLDAVHLAAPFLEAAFALLQGSRGVVLDLRRNGGGDPGTLTLVLDWLLGDKPTHISDVLYKDRTRQWWTAGRGPDRALPRDVPVAALVSARTFSSGEALAYHFQSQGRGAVVGQATPGAADHITPIVLDPFVRAFLPEARVRDAVTGANWEGTGVVPDVACEPERTLEAALDVLQSH